MTRQGVFQSKVVIPAPAGAGAGCGGKPEMFYVGIYAGAGMTVNSPTPHLNKATAYQRSNARDEPPAARNQTPGK